MLVLTEWKEDRLTKGSAELLQKARDIADFYGEKVMALSFQFDRNNSQEAELICLGADQVLVVEHPFLQQYFTEVWTECIAQIAERFAPRLLLFEAAPIGNDLAARLSIRLNSGLVSDCTELKFNQESEELVLSRPADMGDAMLNYTFQTGCRQVATIKSVGNKEVRIDETRTGEVIPVNVVLSRTDMPLMLNEMIQEKKGGRGIEEAEYLIAGGRGAGGVDGFQELQKLADLIGGEVATSRVNVDEGWIDKERQVGLSGKTVHPKLYLACGISGSMHHLVGMADSETIIAINIDRNAPIFDVADIGIVGDVQEILTKVIREIERRRRK